MLERGIEVDHSIIYRWVQDYVPELDKRVRRFLNPTNVFWRVCSDELNNIGTNSCHLAV